MGLTGKEDHQRVVGSEWHCLGYPSYDAGHGAALWHAAVSLAAHPLIVVLLPSITWRTEPTYRMDVPDILAVPHSAPHFGANRGNI